MSHEFIKRIIIEIYLKYLSQANNQLNTLSGAVVIFLLPSRHLLVQSQQRKHQINV